MKKFAISPEDCLIVLAFKNHSTLREVAAELGCDPGGLLRKVQRIASESALLEKISGHWQLTSKGNSIISWVEESIQSQNRCLQSKTTLRIATTMWLSEQVIVPGLSQLNRKLKKEMSFMISTPTVGFEKEMLMGGADFVVSCQIPHDPVIAHKKIVKEDYRIVVPSSWSKDLKHLSDEATMTLLSERPYIRHDYLNPDLFLSHFFSKKPEIEIAVDHLIGARAAIVSDQGWSCVPRLLVKEALRLKLVFELNIVVPSDSHICLWWRRENREAKKIAETISEWIYYQS